MIIPPSRCLHSTLSSTLYSQHWVHKSATVFWLSMMSFTHWDERKHQVGLPPLLSVHFLPWAVFSQTSGRPAPAPGRRAVRCPGWALPAGRSTWGTHACTGTSAPHPVTRACRWTGTSCGRACLQHTHTPRRTALVGIRGSRVWCQMKSAKSAVLHTACRTVEGHSSKWLLWPGKQKMDGGGGGGGGGTFSPF